MNPLDRCSAASGFPVQGEFHGKGALKIIASSGAINREGTTCRLSFVTHLTGDATNLTLEWMGNLVAHCDDGAKIHAAITGPTGFGLEKPGEGGIQQVVTGVIRDK